MSSNGDPVIPERLLYSGPSSQVDQRSAGLRAVPLPAAPLFASPRPGGHVRPQPPEPRRARGGGGVDTAWNGYAAAAPRARAGRARRVGTLRAAAIAFRAPRPVPGWPGTERGVGRAGARWGVACAAAAVGVGRGGCGEMPVS